MGGADEAEVASLIKSESDTPWFWYFLATDTTNRRLERTKLVERLRILLLDPLREGDSSSRVISGY